MAAMDREFVQKAASGGLMEVELGKLAQQRGSASQVKQLGRRLERDHSRANRELASIAKSQGMTLPQEMDAEHRSHVEQLRNLSGQEFDKRFLEMQAEHHRKDIADFQRQASEGQNPRLKTFTSKQLPVLKEHLAMTEGDQGTASRDATSGSGARQGRQEPTGQGEAGKRNQDKK